MSDALMLKKVKAWRAWAKAVINLDASVPGWSVHEHALEEVAEAKRALVNLGEMTVDGKVK